MPERAQPKKKQRRMAVTVGMFVLGTVVLLIFSIFWIKNFSLRPAYSFYARFLEPPYITNGSPVYFRGLKVGHVGNIKLTADASAVLIRLDITQRDLKLPINTQVTIHTEGITGVVYVILTYPQEERPSPFSIQNGMIVQGVEPFSLEKVERALNSLAEKGKLDAMFEDAQDLLAQSKSFVTEYRQVARKASRFLDGATDLAYNTNTMVSDARGVVKGVGQVVTRNGPVLHETLMGFQEASSGVKGLVGSAGKAIGSSGNPSALQQATQSVTRAMDQWQQASQDIQQTSGYIRQELQQSGLLQNVGQTAQNVNMAAKRFDCIQEGVGHLLNNRFLLFKLAFGKPGHPLAPCLENFVPMTVHRPLVSPKPVSGGCSPQPILLPACPGQAP